MIKLNKIDLYDVINIRIFIHNLHNKHGYKYKYRPHGRYKYHGYMVNTGTNQ